MQNHTCLQRRAGVRARRNAGMVNKGGTITAKRMISGLVLKYLNGERFVIRRGYETARPVSSSFCLTVPDGVFCHLRTLQPTLPAQTKFNLTVPLGEY